MEEWMIITSSLYSRLYVFTLGVLSVTTINKWCTECKGYSQLISWLVFLVSMNTKSTKMTFHLLQPHSTSLQNIIIGHHIITYPCWCYWNVQKHSKLTQDCYPLNWRSQFLVNGISLRYVELVYLFRVYSHLTSDGYFSSFQGTGSYGLAPKRRKSGVALSGCSQIFVLTSGVIKSVLSRVCHQSDLIDCWSYSFIGSCIHYWKLQTTL